MSQNSLREKLLIGPKRVSPLKSLMQFLDEKCSEYYPITINSSNYKNSLPNFSKAVTIDSSKIYRANVPGYFYRSISGSTSTSSISVLLCHSNEFYIDHVYLGYTSKEHGSFNQLLYSSPLKKKVIDDSPLQNTVACNVQVRKADNGISEIIRQYFCNTNSVGCQLVAVVPGAGSTFTTTGCGLTSVTTNDEGKCTYKGSLVNIRAARYTADTQSTAYGLTSASGFYFQYWDESDATLLFVPAFCWSGSNPSNAITEIRSSDLSSEGGDFSPGDIPWEVGCGDSSQHMFSDENEGIFYRKGEWKAAPDKGNFSYSGHEDESADGKICDCFMDMFNFCSLEGQSDSFMIASLSSIKELHSTEKPWKAGTSLYDIIKKEYSENMSKKTP